MGTEVRQGVDDLSIDEDARPPPSSELFSNTSSVQSDLLLQEFHDYQFDRDPEFQKGLSHIVDNPQAAVVPNVRAQLILHAQCFYFSRKFNIQPPLNPAQYQSWENAQQEKTSSEIATATAAPTANYTVTTTGALPTDTASAGAQSSTPLVTHSQLSSEAQAKARQSRARAQSVSQQSQPPAPALSHANTPGAQEAQNRTPPQPPPYPISFAAVVDLITNNKPIPGIEEIPDTVLDPGSSKRDTTTRRRKPWEKDEPTVESSPTTTTTTTLPTTTISTPISSDHPPEEQQPVPVTANNKDDLNLDQILHARRTGHGVVHILHPNAVPERGLIAKE